MSGHCFFQIDKGLCTALDLMTDYLNTHKLIMVIADDIAKGTGNTTSEICLSMMADFVVATQGIKLHSYIIIADGHKGHIKYTDFMIMITLLWNPQSNNMCLLSLFLNLAALLELMTWNWISLVSATARLCWWHPCRRRCSIKGWWQIFQYNLESKWCLSRSMWVGFTFVHMDIDTRDFPDFLSRMVSCMMHDEQLWWNKDYKKSEDLSDNDTEWVMSCSFLFV